MDPARSYVLHKRRGGRGGQSDQNSSEVIQTSIYHYMRIATARSPIFINSEGFWGSQVPHTCSETRRSFRAEGHPCFWDRLPRFSQAQRTLSGPENRTHPNRPNTSEHEPEPEPKPKTQNLKLNLAHNLNPNPKVNLSLEVCALTRRS